MAKLYDGTDLFWDGTNGDLLIGSDGDILSTEFDALQAIAQDVYDRIKCDKGDWPEAPLTGASLSDFIGEPNRRETGTNISKRVLSSMQTYGTIDLADLTVDVVPISKERVAIILKLAVMPTARNRSSRVLTKQFIYSYVENNVYPRS
jgi:hypothetical protein